MQQPEADLLTEPATFCRKSPFRWAGYLRPAARLLVTLLIIVIFSLYRHEWLMLGLCFFVACIISLVTYGLINSGLREQMQEICIDPIKGSISFHHFIFITGFLPANPVIVQEITYSGILELRFVPAIGDTEALQLTTTKGHVAITSDMQGFDLIRKTLLRIIEENKSKRDAYQKSKAEVPVIKTPWYGWLLLLVPVCVIFDAVYRFLY